MQTCYIWKQSKTGKINKISLHINRCQVDAEDSFKYLGVVMHKNMSWLDHIDQLNVKICQRLEALRLVNLLPRDARITSYYSLNTTSV